MLKYLCALGVLVLKLNFNAQSFPPPAGHAGSTAISKDSIIFTSWAQRCTVNRGYQDISQPALGKATAGQANDATGKDLQPLAVSLGDGGSAICEFESPLYNGPGFDFAVFENGFNDVFLEFAFVEVSSNGIDFFRFPNTSNTSTLIQTGPFDTTNTRLINGLAGKYRAGYGTPFDLSDIQDAEGLDKNNICFIKILDVIGAVSGSHKSLDSQGNIINDPWPTPFSSSGFDLDAIGVIHAKPVGLNKMYSKTCPLIIQNPISKQHLSYALSLHPDLKLYNIIHQPIQYLTEGLIFIKHGNDCIHRILVMP